MSVIYRLFLKISPISCNIGGEPYQSGWKTPVGIGEESHVHVFILDFKITNVNKISSHSLQLVFRNILRSSIHNVIRLWPVKWGNNRDC